MNEEKNRTEDDPLGQRGHIGLPGSYTFHPFPAPTTENDRQVEIIRAAATQLAAKHLERIAELELECDRLNNVILEAKVTGAPPSSINAYDFIINTSGVIDITAGEQGAIVYREGKKPIHLEPWQKVVLKRDSEI